MRKCDIDLKTLERAVRDMEAFAKREGRQEQVDEAWAASKEAKQPCLIIKEGNGYALGEYVRPGFDWTMLLLSFAVGADTYEVMVFPLRGGTYDLMHHQHVQQAERALEKGLVQEGVPPHDYKLVAAVEDGEWHEYAMRKTKDAVAWHGQYKRRAIYLGPKVEDAIAEMAWLLIRDRKAADDVTEWFVDYCGEVTRPKTEKSGHLDKQEYLGTLFDGEYKCHIGPDSMKNFLNEKLREGNKRRGVLERDSMAGRKLSNPNIDRLDQGLEISVLGVSELLTVPESTIRDAISAGKIHPRIESTERRPGYVRHKRKRYYFNKEQVEEARNYFTPHVRDRNLRRLIIGRYIEKRCPSGDYEKCYDAARQWIYRELRRDPEPTLEDLLIRVKKMKKLKAKGEEHGH